MRAPSGRSSIAVTDPARCCTEMVTTLATAARTKNGIFSATIRHALLRLKRASGQQSKSSMTNGHVTSIALLINPNAKKHSDKRYKVEDGRRPGTHHPRSAVSRQ